MRILVCCEQPEQASKYRQLAINTGSECGAEDCVGPAELSAGINLRHPDAVLVTIGSDPSAGIEAVKRAAGHGKVPVIAIGPAAESAVILQALRAGAREYIVEEQARDELVAALLKLQQAGNVQWRRGKMLAVLGATPGSGVTTVATGLAFALAAQHPQQVVLGELGNTIPELALDLDLKPRNTISQLLHDWQRMDGAVVRQAAVEHSGGALVLADAPGVTPAPIVPEACRQLVALLRTQFDFTVLDLGHGTPPPAIREALKLADAIVLVIRLDVPSLHMSRALMQQLDQWEIPLQKLLPLANRYGQKKQIAWKDAEESLGLALKEWIPDDPASLNYALNHGKPLVQAAPWAKITKQFQHLAHSLTGVMQS